MKLADVPVLVLSLPSATENRARMREVLRDFSSVTFVDGIVLPTKADLDAWCETRGFETPQMPRMLPKMGDVSVMVAHLQVFEHIVASSIPLCLVVEDDVAMNPAVDPKTREIAPPVHDIVFLHPMQGFGAYCQLVTLEGARAMVCAADRILASDAPIDLVWWQRMLTDLNVAADPEAWLFVQRTPFNQVQHSTRMQLNADSTDGESEESKQMSAYAHSLLHP